MTDYWKLSPLEYAVGWRAFGWDRLHYPIQYRPTALNQDDYIRDCVDATTTFTKKWGDDLYGVFVTLAAPHARLHACGVVGAGDAKKVRIYAGIRGNNGAVAAQEPGGTVHLYRLPAAALGRRVAEALPPVGAGSAKPMRVHLADFDPQPDDDPGQPTTWMQPVDDRPTSKQQWTQFISRPRVGFGRIEVYPGPALDNRDTGGCQDLHWLDLANDGRYIITQTRDTATAGPIGVLNLANYLQGLLNNATNKHLNHATTA